MTEYDYASIDHAARTMCRLLGYAWVVQEVARKNAEAQQYHLAGLEAEATVLQQYAYQLESYSQELVR